MLYQPMLMAIPHASTHGIRAITGPAVGAGPALTGNCDLTLTAGNVYPC